MGKPKMQKVKYSKTKPFGLFEWMVARRYIAATKDGSGVSLISIFAFLGIALAVMVLITVMSVMQGFRAKFLDQLLSVQGHGNVSMVEYGPPLDDYDSIINRVMELDGVTHAYPMVSAPVLVTGARQDGAVVFGMRKEDLMQIEYVTGEGHFQFGSMDEWGEGRKGGNKIIVGDWLAYKLGVTVGDKVTLMTGHSQDTPFGSAPNTKPYEIVGIFKIGNSEIDAISIYMPLEQAQLFFNRRQEIDKIEIKIEQPEKINDYVASMNAILKGTYKFTTWEQVNESYVNALKMERSMMRLVMSFIVIIAMLNITTGLVMLVKDKISDIAILRTIGATKGAVMRIFMMAGALIGITGTLIGIVMGIIVTLNIGAIEVFLSKALSFDIFNEDVYLFTEVPAQINYYEVGFIAIFSFILCLISTIYPALRASNLDPVEALRYE